MKMAVIGVLILVQLVDFFLKYLNYKNRNAPILENVRDIYDAETYAKQQLYSMERLKLSIISGLSSLGIIIALLAFNVHSNLFDYMGQFTSNIYLKTYFMFGVSWLIQLPIRILFDTIGTFKIEAKYGFNKTSAKTFIADIIKDAVFNGIVISLGLMTMFMWLHGLMGNMVFIVFFFILVVFITIFVFFNSLLMRITYKFTPLEDGTLKDKIVAVSKAENFPVKRVFVVDFSRRSTKSNAFFTGFGRNKTIGIADNLIANFTEDEVLGVVAHEIGHAKGRHILKMAPMQFLMFGAIMTLAFFVVNSHAIAEAFGFVEINPGFGLFIVMLLFAPIQMLLGIPMMFISRINEYEADRYEVKHVGSEVAISAMKKLYRQNFGNLTPHPWVVKLTFSHPTASQRIFAMAATKSEK